MRELRQMLAEEGNGPRLHEQNGAAQHHAAEGEGQAAERHRLADLQRGQAPVRIEPIAHRRARDRREAEIVRQRVGAERGEGDAAVGDLVAGVDRAQAIVEGQDEVGQRSSQTNENTSAWAGIAVNAAPMSFNRR